MIWTDIDCGLLSSTGTISDRDEESMQKYLNENTLKADICIIGLMVDLLKIFFPGKISADNKMNSLFTFS